MNQEKEGPTRSYFAHSLLLIAPIITGIAATYSGAADYLIGGVLFLLVIALAVEIWELGVGNALISSLRKRKDNRVLRVSDYEYWIFLERLRLVCDLEQKISRIKWESLKPLLAFSVQNSLYTMRICLIDLPPHTRLIAANTFIAQMLTSFDRWLNECDSVLRSGAVQYESEDERHDLLALKDKYLRLVDEHNDICERINHELRTTKLQLVYGSEHNFSWSAASPGSIQS